VRRRGIYTQIFMSFLIIILLIVIGCSREGVAPRTNSISGVVTEMGTGYALDGVTMQLTGAATTTVTTDSNGKFSFTGLTNGTYYVTPSLADYTFDPTSAEIVINNADLNNADFSAMLSSPAGSYSISGNVTKVTGGVLQGVTITLSGTANKPPTTTDSSGNYSFTGLVDGSYTVTPSLADYAFTPVSTAVNVAGANETGKNFTATLIATSTYAQSDLTGRWKFQRLSADSSPQWIRIVMNINAAGAITCESYEDSTNVSTCPTPFDFIWTIDENGKITESGNSAHMTMASNKNFIAGTGSLRIAQKIAATFDGTELNDKSFVYHQLKVGTVNEWRYGTGTTGFAGTMTIASETTSGSTPATGDIGVISVDSSGIVTLSSADSFKGFLSDDKKTIVATQTDADGTSYILIIIQITGQTYTAGPAPDSISNVHMMAGGTTPAPLSADWTATTFSGTMFASNYWVSNTAFPAPVPSSPSVDTNGVVTISGDTYHGQISDDGSFTVGTKTLYNGTTPFGYVLIVNTIK
jgi:hypothetical protein